MKNTFVGPSLFCCEIRANKIDFPLPCPQKHHPDMNRTVMRLIECPVASFVHSTYINVHCHMQCHCCLQRTLLHPLCLLHLSLAVVICNNFCLIRKLIESIPHHFTAPLPWDAALTGYLFIYSPYCEPSAC